MQNRSKILATSRKSRLRDVFGTTQEAIDALYQSQNGRCAICGKTEAEALVICKKRLHIDHCHVTGRIRGLLCMKCNGGLGMFSDSAETLEHALKYLRR